MNCQEQLEHYEQLETERKAERHWLEDHEQKDNPANATLADNNGLPVEKDYVDPDKERENAER